MHHISLLLSLPLLLVACASNNIPSNVASNGNVNTQSQDARTSAMELALNTKLDLIRDNPAQASPALIQEIQDLLKAIREAKATDALVETKPLAKANQPAVPKRNPRPTAVASKPTPLTLQTSPALRQPSATPTSIFASAELAEQADDTLQALSLYKRASSMGYGPATRRLMEIYTNGMPGIERNYIKAVRYKNLAVAQGITLGGKYAQ